MATPSLRFALIGASPIARKHAVALSRIEGAELVSVCDLDDQRARRLAAEFEGVQTYTDYRAMLQRDDLDIVSVTTPSGTHASIAQDVAASGRHVVVEKPMALTLEDADAQIAACMEHGVRLFVVMQNRFSRPVRALRRALESGRLGTLVLGTVRLRWCRDQAYYDAASWRGTRHADGGVFRNQACHHVDLLRWMMGDVASVMAMSARRLADIEAGDTGVAILRFTSGALGVIEATTAWRPTDLEGSLTVAGEHGSVEISGFVVDRLTHWAFDEAAPDDADVRARSAGNPDVFAWTHEQFLRDVAGALRDNRPGLVEAMEGRRTLELINAILESSETGLEVPLRFRSRPAGLGRTR